MLDLRHPLARGVFLAATLIIGLFLFFPIYWLVISSLKPNGELYRDHPDAVARRSLVAALHHGADASGNLPTNCKNSLIASTPSAVV